MRRSLLTVPWSHDLVHDDDRDLLILTVVCGTVGIYEITVVLDAAERAAWEEGGAPWLDDLARRIAAEPRSWWHRHRPDP